MSITFANYPTTNGHIQPLFNSPTPVDTFGFGGIDVSGIAQRLVAADVLNDPGSIRRILAEGEQRLATDFLVSKESRRWNVGLPDPARYVPGDVVGLRCFIIAPTLKGRIDEWERLGPNTDPERAAVVSEELFSGIAVSADVYRAVPHYLDAAAAAALVDAEDPGGELIADLRLPYDTVLVFFERRVPLPARYVASPPELRDVAGVEVYGKDGFTVPSQNLAADFQDIDGCLEGIVLFAGPDGVGLSPHVIWLVSTDSNDEYQASYGVERIFGHIPGRLDHALAAPVARNLAAAIGYTDWVAPEPPADAPEFASPQWFDRIRHNKIRRAEERGKFAGVHVIDLARHTAKSAAASAAEPTRHVTTHLRRGHWRSVRVATRNDAGAIVGNVHGQHGTDWNYQGRFIAPVLVNPAGGNPRLTVYRSSSAAS